MAVLKPGDPAPWFSAPTPGRPDFQFGSVAGRVVVLSFIGSAAQPAGQAMLKGLQAERGLFDEAHRALFLVSNDPGDRDRISEGPGVHVFWDFSRQVSDLYGLHVDGRVTLKSFVLDAMLRVIAVVPVRDAARHGAEIAELLAALPAAPVTPAPVLVLPRIFEPEFCRKLIGLYQAGQSAESGFMKTDPASGRTVLVKDGAVKRRRDHVIDDDGVRAQIQQRLKKRLVPEIRKVFQFEATRIERYIVARYDAADHGHFRAHRDNTTRGTAHRRFAVTINLNAEEYEGGDLGFPEFGGGSWRAPTGGAVVFSCSLLHEARAVTRGVRFCFLPFLYDEAAAKIRTENRDFVELPEGTS